MLIFDEEKPNHLCRSPSMTRMRFISSDVTVGIRPPIGYKPSFIEAMPPVIKQSTSKTAIGTHLIGRSLVDEDEGQLWHGDMLLHSKTLSTGNL